jgi:hypothetical protein
MAEYAGSAATITWNSTAGSVTISGDFRKLTIAPKMTVIDSTAGADTVAHKIKGVSDWTASVDLLAQDAAGTPKGTAYTAALGPGVSGTLIIIPNGTSAGTTTMTAFTGGATWNIPYNGVVELSCVFEGDGGTFTQS